MYFLSKEVDGVGVIRLFQATLQTLDMGSQTESCQQSDKQTDSGSVRILPLPPPNPFSLPRKILEKMSTRIRSWSLSKPVLIPPEATL